MLSEREKQDFVLSTVKPMAIYTMPFLTQVVGVIDGNNGKHRGTGFYCMIDGRQAVVTAAHVLRQVAAEGVFTSLAFTRASGERPTIVPGKIVYADDLDLAIYLPSRDFPMGAQKAFWPESRIGRSKETLSRDYLFIQGFPGRFSQSTIDTMGSMVSESLAYGAMMRRQEEDIPEDERNDYYEVIPGRGLLPQSYLQPHQFAFNFSVEPGSFLNDAGVDLETRSSVIEDWSRLFVSGASGTPDEQKPRGAFGLSGSPVWRIGAAGKPIKEWTPDFSELVGIVTGWSESREILIATQASKLFEVLSRADDGLTA